MVRLFDLNFGCVLEVRGFFAPLRMTVCDEMNASQPKIEIEPGCRRDQIKVEISDPQPAPIPGFSSVTVRGSMVPTTATEFRLLDYFARHKGRVFSRDHLLDSVWRDTAYVTPRSVDVYVRRIREKIEPDPENPRYLKTVRGAGYRFEAPK